MAAVANIAHDHRLAIGALRTDCNALVWPDAQPALRAMLDRMTRTCLPTALSDALDPVLDGLDGVVRIRYLRLEVEYLGQFDESALANALAMRIAAALRDALCNGNSDVLRYWPDQSAYFAAYIERRLALTSNPDPSWAFEEFATLDHLPPERAAAEMLRGSPRILIPLAQNAALATDSARFAKALDEPSARALLDALLDPTWPQTTPDALATALRLMDTKLRRLAITEPARTALSLTLILLARTHGRHIHEALSAATLASALVHLQRSEDTQHTGSRQDETSFAARATTSPLLSPTVITFIDKRLEDPVFQQRAVDIMPSGQASARPREAADGTVVEATPGNLHSPIAGIGLLLPVIADLGLFDHLSPRHLRDAALSTLGVDQQTHAITDPLFASLFPVGHHPTDQSVAPVPEALQAHLAPETLPLLNGDGSNAWGNLVLAAFATRLPGLKASSRGYLQAQFLHTPGRLSVGEEVIDLTLQGPDLAIILKMAGFDGAQQKLPHLGNRLLIITLAGLVS